MYLGLGRDRNSIDDRRLILGIPAMVQDLLDRDCKRQYKGALTSLCILTMQPGTALKELTVNAVLARFERFSADRERLSQGLHANFMERHPDAIPICSACVKASDQAEVCQQPVVLLDRCISSVLRRSASLTASQCSHELVVKVNAVVVIETIANLPCNTLCSTLLQA